MKRFRDPFNGFSHLGALILSLVGTFILLGLTRPDPWRMFATAVYGLSMSASFLTSTMHHLIKGDRTLEIRLWKLDHAAIYPFIAGTYTPICLYMLPGRSGFGLLIVVWILAVLGMVYKLALSRPPQSVKDPPDLRSTLIYVAMGWLILWKIAALTSHSVGLSLILAVVGGFLYTMGGVILSFRLFDFWPDRFGHHEIWHLFVIAGASCFYGYIYWNFS